jgi:beta-glucanase (GH16 family)
MKYTILLSSLIILTIKVHSQCDFGSYLCNNTTMLCDTNPWVLVFEDNFNGNSLDLSKWRPETGVPRDVNFEIQKAWHKPENIVVGNGLLKIISKREILNNMPVVTNWNPYTVKYENFEYSSGEIWTKFKFEYGKFEARVKIPKGKGFYPAFWTFGNPPWNEIDIFEFWNEDDASKLSKVHRMASIYNGYNCFDDYTGVDFSQDFHIFTMEWSPDHIRWFVDGVMKRELYQYYNILMEPVICQINKAHVYQYLKAFPWNPMAIIFNTAIQNKSNSPDNSTPFPSQMEVDWIRYYKRTSNPCQDVTITNASQFPLSNVAFNAIVGNNVAINCSFTVPNGQQLDIVAGNSVTLGSGLSVELGSAFNVRIEPTVCN